MKTNAEAVLMGASDGMVAAFVHNFTRPFLISPIPLSKVAADSVRRHDMTHFVQAGRPNTAIQFEDHTKPAVWVWEPNRYDLRKKSDDDHRSRWFGAGRPGTMEFIWSCQPLLASQHTICFKKHDTLCALCDTLMSNFISGDHTSSTLEGGNRRA